MTAQQSWADRLVEVGRAVTSELEQRVLFDRILQTARELTGARYAALGILNDDGDKLRTFLTCGVDDQTHRLIGELPQGRGVLGALITHPKPLRLVDVAHAATSHGFPSGHPVMRSFLGVPVLIAGRAWGNLYVTEKAGGPFTKQDEQAAVILAGWASVAIENARLYEISEHGRERAERATCALEAARDVTVAIGDSETDLTSVLALIARSAGELVGATGVVVWLRDGDDLVRSAVAGRPRRVEPAARLPADIPDAVDALDLTRPQRLTASHSHVAQELGVPEGSFALLVPMSYRTRPVGLLVAVNASLDTDGFTADDEYVLSTFAASAATALALAQSVAGDRLRGALAAAEGERTRWARELHDETLQSLGGLRMLLGATLRYPKDLAETRAVVQTGMQEVQGVIDDLRGLITELRPAALDELGLEAALDALLDRHRHSGSWTLTGTLALRDPKARGCRLDRELENTAYRLVQEALTNVAKHAGAQHVQVSAQESDAQLTLEIADDGHGFDAHRANPGFGLTGMRERMSLARGSLTITSDQSGTVVRACLPLPTPTPGTAGDGVPSSGSPRGTTGRLPPPTAAATATTDWTESVRRFGDALRAADGRRAETVAQDALADGLSPAEVMARVITPAMYWIGDLWARGAITVADEHAATAIAHGVLASMRSAPTDAAAELGATVLLAAPEGEPHGLGLRMAADVLDAAGLHVIYFGTDVPVDSLIQTVAAYQPALLGLSLTLPHTLSHAKTLIAAINRAHRETHVLIGGQGVPEWLIDDHVTPIATIEILIDEVHRILAPPPAMTDQRFQSRSVHAHLV
jgi:signal transduction histidine kinase/methanogenic corrinoid protein MtbC1